MPSMVWQLQTLAGSADESAGDVSASQRSRAAPQLIICEWWAWHLWCDAGCELPQNDAQRVNVHLLSSSALPKQPHALHRSGHPCIYTTPRSWGDNNELCSCLNMSAGQALLSCQAGPRALQIFRCVFVRDANRFISFLSGHAHLSPSRTWGAAQDRLPKTTSYICTHA